MFHIFKQRRNRCTHHELLQVGEKYRKFVPVRVLFDGNFLYQQRIGWQISMLAFL